MFQFKRVTVIAFAFAMTALAASSATSVPDGVTHVRSVEGIDEYVLENGLTVLLFPDPSLPTTTVNITYLVGSRHEGYGERGMAHLLEHLLFKGSKNHPNVYDELTSHGSRPNGTTWTDRTNYFETFSASDENLDWALDLEADRMVNAFVTAEALEPEMTVVRNEFEIGENSPARVLEERVYSTAFLWHNYGLSTIGNRSDIENVPIENLQAFYKKWYRPENAILAIGGRFDADHTLSLVVDKYASIPNPTTPLPDTYTIEPPQDGERSVTLRRVGDTQAVSAAYHVPSGAHPDFAAVDVLAFLLGDTPSGRLHEALVETDLATDIRTNADQFKDPGLLYINASLRRDQSVDAAEAEMLRVVEGFAAEPPSEADVARARENLLRRWDTTLRNTPRATIRLSEWASMGDWRLLFVHRDRLQEVTPDDVTRVANAYLVQANRTVGRFIPTDAPMRAAVSETPDVAAMIGDYEGREAPTMGEAFDPSPASIESRLVRTSLPVGLDVVMLPKKTRGATVNVALQLHYGDETSLAGQRAPSGMLGTMLMRGTTTRDRLAIEDELDRLRSQMSVWSGRSQLTATIETTRDLLPATMDLLADVLRQPSFPPKELTLLKKERLLALDQDRTDPRAVAVNRLTRHLDPWPASDPRYVPTIDEQIDEVEAVTRADLVRFHEEFLGASYGEIAIVGDFETDAVLGQLDALFGDWAAARPYERLADVANEVDPIREAIQIPDKESAMFRAGIEFPVRDDDPDYPALTLGNFMTGGGFLNSRLATRIRVKDGLSYGVRSWFGADAFDESASFSGYAIYAPQNDERLLNAFTEEITRIVEKGFTADEVADAKSGWLKRQNVSRGQDDDLARHLAMRTYQGRNMKWDESLEKNVEALSGDVIHAAFRRHIDPKRISIVRAGDFRDGTGAQAARAD